MIGLTVNGVTITERMLAASQLLGITIEQYVADHYLPSRPTVNAVGSLRSGDLDRNGDIN